MSTKDLCEFQFLCLTKFQILIWQPVKKGGRLLGRGCHLEEYGIYFVKIVKISYHNYPPPITAPANKGQNLQVPSRPLSRGNTVLVL